MNIVHSFVNNQKQVQTQRESSKGGKVKSSQTRSQSQPSTNAQVPSGNTGRPHVCCSTCGGLDHLRKDCGQDVFCTWCRTRSHATEMCCAATKTGMNNAICVYCGSANQTLNKCLNRPNDNREEPRLTPRDLKECRTGSSGNNDSVFKKNQGNHHQTRFDKRLNRQYLPNYNN